MILDLDVFELGEVDEIYLLELEFHWGFYYVFFFHFTTYFWILLILLLLF